MKNMRVSKQAEREIQKAKNARLVMKEKGQKVEKNRKIQRDPGVPRVRNENDPGAKIRIHPETERSQGRRVEIEKGQGREVEIEGGGHAQGVGIGNRDPGVEIEGGGDLVPGAGEGASLAGDQCLEVAEEGQGQGVELGGGQGQEVAVGHSLEAEEGREVLEDQGQEVVEGQGHGVEEGDPGAEEGQGRGAEIVKGRVETGNDPEAGKDLDHIANDPKGAETEKIPGRSMDLQVWRKMLLENPRIDPKTLIRTLSRTCLKLREKMKT